MQTARSAIRTQAPSLSAVEYTASASRPSSWQARITRTAISPRLATSTRLNISAVASRSGRDLELRLPELHRLGFLDQDPADGARVLGLQLVEQLHGLEHAQRLADLDAVALLDEHRLARRRR